MEDEEFILENSPLDAYLKEVTSEDFSRYESLSNIENFTDVNDVAKSSTTILNDQHCHKSGIEVSVEDEEVLLAASHFLDSGLMNSDDYNLLIDIHDEIDDVLKVIPTTQQQRLHSQEKTNLLNPLYEHRVAILVLLLSVLVSFLLSLYSTVVFVVLSSIFGCFYYICCFQKSEKSEPLPNIPLSKAKDFVKIYINIDHIVDKCIKHIKEVEVINTGLQIYRDKIIATDQILLSGRTQKCLQLRNVLLDMVTDLILELRTNLRHLLQSNSEKLFSFKEEYVSSIPLDKFGDIVSLEKKLSLQDDNLVLPDVSLEKLKSLVYLYRALLSEFVLALTVCLYTGIKNVSTHNNLTDLYNAIDELFNVSKKYPEILNQKLSRSLKLNFSKDNETRTTPRGRTNMKTTSTIKESESEQYFNNCKINLYSALKRMEEAEDIIFRNNKDSLTAATSIDLFEKIVLEFFMNIDNARACLEDVLDLHKPKSQKNAEVDQTSKPLEDDYGVDVLGSIPMSAILKQEMGDRMYEGESLEIPGRGVEEPIDIEYLQQQLKEKRESKRLLRELKTVFKVKESPEGLLSFPLAKGAHADDEDFGNEHVDDEDELERQEEQDEITVRQARRKNKYLLQRDEDFCGTADGDNERLQFKDATPIGLPVSLLQHGFSSMLKNNMMVSSCGATEETFGSSDDDVDSDVNVENDNINVENDIANVKNDIANVENDIANFENDNK